MKARVFVAAALVGGFVFGAVAQASAHISEFAREVVTFETDTDSGDMSGVITCDAGETFVVTGRVAQKDPGYRGSGSTGGTCAGASQDWELSYSRVSGDMVNPLEFRGGSRTRVLIVAKTFDAGVLHDKERIVFFTD